MVFAPLILDNRSDLARAAIFGTLCEQGGITGCRAVFPHHGNAPGPRFVFWARMPAPNWPGTTIFRSLRFPEACAEKGRYYSCHVLPDPTGVLISTGIKWSPDFFGMCSPFILFQLNGGYGGPMPLACFFHGTTFFFDRRILDDPPSRRDLEVWLDRRDTLSVYRAYGFVARRSIFFVFPTNCHII